MSKSEHVDVLVSAFKAAWDHYFRPDRSGDVLECLARPALAEFLVSKVRQGVTDEPSLASAGLQFLFSLEDVQDDTEPADVASPSWSMRLENASARFLPVIVVRRLRDAA